MTPTREERKENTTRKRKRQILDAALEVFSRKGFAESTTAEIAQTAGVAEGTIYNYFKSKRDLLIELIMRDVVTQPFQKMLEKTGIPDDESFMSAVIGARLDFRYNGMDKYMFVMTEIQKDPELRKKYAEKAITPFFEVLEKYLETRTAVGAFRDVNAKILSRAIPGMVMGMLLLYRIEGEKSPLHEVPTGELTAEIVNLILRGLQRRDEK